MKAKPQYSKRLKSVIDLLNKLAEPELAEPGEQTARPATTRAAAASKGSKPKHKPR